MFFKELHQFLGGHSTFARESFDHISIKVVPHDKHIGTTSDRRDQSKGILSGEYHGHILVRRHIAKQTLQFSSLFRAHIEIVEVLQDHEGFYSSIKEVLHLGYLSMRYVPRLRIHGSHPVSYTHLTLPTKA